MSSEQAALMQQAEAEKLTLLVADNKTGCFGVAHQPGRPKPYQARVSRGGKQVLLGYFATAEEAALCIARSPEGQAVAAERAAAAVPLTSEEARQQAQAEGLAESKTGYSCVSLSNPGRPKPFEAAVRRDGKNVSLGYFATAEEAALSVARSPEGRAIAVERAEAAVSLTSEEACQQAQAEGLTLRVVASKTGFHGVSLTRPGHLKPFKAAVRRSGKQVHLGYIFRHRRGGRAVHRVVADGAGGSGRAGCSGAAANERGAAAGAGGESKLTLRLAGNTAVAENTAGYFGIVY